MSDPCPFEDLGKHDNHRGVPYLTVAELGPLDQTLLVELTPSMQTVIQRYVRTMDQSKVSGKEAQILRQTMPGQTGTYVVHCWSSAMDDMLETLQMVVAADDVVLVPG